ncbi:hypothetical protein VA7868_00392 [Vibrio aerogenes CECT 7868]|uniref:Uncharacterized protein n=1 Tax=Vibrio aerogenes CECT 7868 TaxID=1216006 RepID=A0A1M5VHJ2_9VIBR|nr:hypothetical protein [Vibrio aerogenes]SHH74696.1 hypothetical protein VA7868_00392 [Vibrio aerogenes CECT 7868]
MNRHDVCSKFFSPGRAIKIGPVPSALKPNIKKTFSAVFGLSKTVWGACAKSRLGQRNELAHHRCHRSWKLQHEIWPCLGSPLESPDKPSQIKESSKDEQTRCLFKIFLAREGDKNWSCPARTQAKYKKDFFGGFWSFKNRLGRLRQKLLGSAKRIGAP